MLRLFIEEAELLFNNKRWARTVFVCHTAGEEFGKSIQCFSAIVDHARGVLDGVKFRKRLLNHHAKMQLIGFFEAMVTPGGDPIENPNDMKNLDKLSWRQ